MTKKKAEDVVNLIFDSMTHALARGERIEIRGLGSPFKLLALFLKLKDPAGDGAALVALQVRKLLQDFNGAHLFCFIVSGFCGCPTV